MACLSLLFSEEPQCAILRPYVVYGSSVTVLLSVFFFFAFFGWPGGPIGCVYEEPYDGCYCESFELEDVEEGNPGIRQPVNTWFNLFAILTSGFVAWRLSEDRRYLYSTTEEDPNDNPHYPGSGSACRTVGATAGEDEEDRSRQRNVMRSSNLIADWYILTTVFCGLGKMYFHGSLTLWGTYMDGVSSNFFFAFLPWYTFRRIYQSDRLFWVGYFVTIVLISALQVIFGSLFGGEMMMIFYCFLELYIFATTGVFLGALRSKFIWFTAFALLLVATVFWWASQTGRIMCYPDSFWQIHGLVWHPLLNIGMVVMYLYWREEGNFLTEPEEESSENNLQEKPRRSSICDSHY